MSLTKFAATVVAYATLNEKLPQRNGQFSKGQLISFDVLNFPKKQRKNLVNFCPRI